MESEKHFTGHVQHSDVPPTLSVRAAVANQYPVRGWTLGQRLNYDLLHKRARVCDECGALRPYVECNTQGAAGWNTCDHGLAALRASNAELAAALRAFLSAATDGYWSTGRRESAINQAQAALARSAP